MDTHTHIYIYTHVYMNTYIYIYSLRHLLDLLPCHDLVAYLARMPEVWQRALQNLTGSTALASCLGSIGHMMIRDVSRKRNRERSSRSLLPGHLLEGGHLAARITFVSPGAALSEQMTERTPHQKSPGYCEGLCRSHGSSVSDFIATEHAAVRPP